MALTAILKQAHATRPQGVIDAARSENLLTILLLSCP